jgi:hypothetical protein
VTLALESLCQPCFVLGIFKIGFQFAWAGLDLTPPDLCLPSSQVARITGYPVKSFWVAKGEELGEWLCLERVLGGSCTSPPMALCVTSFWMFLNWTIYKELVNTLALCVGWSTQPVGSMLIPGR